MNTETEMTQDIFQNGFNHFSETLAHALEMSPAEKRMLIIHVEESLKKDYRRIAPEIAKAQEMEAARRYKNYLDGKEPSISFEESLKRLKT